MTVKELKDILNKVENENNEVYFEYMKAPQIYIRLKIGAVIKEDNRVVLSE